MGTIHNTKHAGMAAPRPSGSAAWLALVLLLLSAGGLGGCLEANTLGDEPPDEVTVGSPPAWDNGMQELMTLKCGVCHQVPVPAHAPDNTPDEYDFTVLHGTGGGDTAQFLINGAEEVEGAADALGDIKEQVLEGSMPLDFSTPLTDSEYDAILDWDGT